MAYQVDKFNGTFLVSVDDGTIDTTTDLRFVGKNYAGYGEVQNENFLHLMENFANTSPPPKVVTGQIWFDTANKKLKFYDGTQFRTAGGAEAKTTAPSGLTPGDFWFDTSAEQLYAWNGTEFVLIGPENAPDTGTSALIPQVVKDTVGVNHSIGKFLSGGEVIAVISKDAFTLNSTLNPITGFTAIKKGLNLVNTNGSTGVTTTDHFFWGTASNSLKLGGFTAEDFVRAGSTLSGTFRATGIGVGDTGITIGDQNDLRIYVENGDEPAIENQLGNAVKIKIRITESSANEVAIFQSVGMLPGTDNTYVLGSSGSKWSAVYATGFFGDLTGNVTGNVVGSVRGNVLATDGTTIFNAATKNITATFNGLLNGNVVGDLIGTANNALALNGIISNTAAVATTLALRDPSGNLTANRFLGIADFADRLKIDDAAVDTNPTFRSAKTTATANTIAARDSSGNLTANIFNGTATAARYADLAENYLADQAYDIGTVIAVGGEKEVRAAMFGERAIGVVSEKPAYLMNKDLEGGTAVALKGRVPVKVVGSIKKGDRLIASDNGVAVVAAMHSVTDVFAISLEDNQDTSIKLVEAIVL